MLVIEAIVEVERFVKIKVFSWLYLINKILTWDNFQNMTWNGLRFSYLCRMDE
jgi:hypothetical protein